MRPSILEEQGLRKGPRTCDGKRQRAKALRIRKGYQAQKGGEHSSWSSDIVQPKGAKMTYNREKCRENRVKMGDGFLLLASAAELTVHDQCALFGPFEGGSVS